MAQLWLPGAGIVYTPAPHQLDSAGMRIQCVLPGCRARSVAVELATKNHGLEELGLLVEKFHADVEAEKDRFDAHVAYKIVCDLAVLELLEPLAPRFEVLADDRLLVDEDVYVAGVLIR